MQHTSRWMSLGLILSLTLITTGCPSDEEDPTPPVQDMTPDLDNPDTPADTPVDEPPTTTVAALEESGVERFDIPAFLRRQAD